MATSKNKDYSITINLLIFVTLISIVVVTRIVFVRINHQNTFEDISIVEQVYYDGTADMENIILKVKNTMEDYYNLNIYYGEILDEIVPQVNANVITDEKDILNMLQDINEEFSKYPKGIIDEIQEKGYVISIYLVDSFNNGNIALANRTANGYFNIFLSNDEEFEKAMHHEFYHILEYYIKLQYDIDLAYINWSKYNPEKFNYESDIKKLTNKYVYGIDIQNTIHFVTLYSKTNAMEDRAEIFSEMMVGNEEYNLNKNNINIINKMRCITKVLDNSFVSVQDNEYWSRYNEWEI